MMGCAKALAAWIESLCEVSMFPHVAEIINVLAGSRV